MTLNLGSTFKPASTYAQPRVIVGHTYDDNGRACVIYTNPNGSDNHTYTCLETSFYTWMNKTRAKRVRFF